jgi:S-adenosylmethionine:tRNA ribosyltransferase-isomerase
MGSAGPGRRDRETSGLRTDEFDYTLPGELIAQHPVEPRDRARLMVLRRASGTWEHRSFSDLPELLTPGDVLVRNDTRVIPARLVGTREQTGGRWEGLFLRDRPDGTWEILARTRGTAKPGEFVRTDTGLRLRLVDRVEGGTWLVRPLEAGPVTAILDRHGRVPLPPYIRKGQEGPGDRSSYQTHYATRPGAVAAPTAGLHFTPVLLRRLGERGLAIRDVTLHVGIGTFRPIEAERIEDHALHAEWAEVSEEVAASLAEARRRGSRLVAVGTTTVRTLETAAQSGTIRPFAGETALYLKPGHAFRAADAMITNFHLPRSSLLVLVAAFAGPELVRAAYAEAVRRRYRFYSYGDAMLIL